MNWRRKQTYSQDLRNCVMTTESRARQVAARVCHVLKARSG